MGSLAIYRDLLRNRPLTKLLLGEFVSNIGDWLYIVAIFVVIYQESGDAALVGIFGAIRLLPYVLLSVPAGIVADRFPRRTVLIISDLYRGAIMVLLTIGVFVHVPTVVIAGLAILAACGSTFLYPALGAYLPSLAADERQLGPANSAFSSLQNLSYITGPAIGGILIAIGGVEWAFILNAASFLVIAAVLWTLPPSGPLGGKKPAPAEPAAEAAPQAVPAAASSAVVTAEGAATAATVAPAAETKPASAPTSPIQLRPLAGFTVVQLMAGFLGGGFQVITVILAIDVLKAGEEANGYLNAAIGVGGLIGAAWAGILVLRRGLGLPLVIGSIVGGVGSIALGLTTNLALALIFIGVSAAGALIIDVVGTTLFQRLLPNELLGRGVGTLMTVTQITGMAGAFAMPVLLAQLGPLPTFGGVGIALIVLTALGVAVIGDAATRAPTPYEAVLARISTLPLFAGVPQARLERAMHRLKEVPVTAGQAVVREGEPADRFYIIERGSFTVSQVQGPDSIPVVLRKLGAEQVFGELGLLNQRPRSATVTADEDGVVLALEGRDFLELVGVNETFRGRLLGLYSGPGPSR